MHHPIWDYDLSSAPILADINVNGKPIKAVALPSKQAFLYVFDRVTGKPVWPIEERPVPQSDVPGEKTSPTQPFPTKPPAYARNFLKIPDDLIDFTPEMRAQARDLVARYRWKACSFRRWLAIRRKWLGALNLGNGTGGTNWPGAAYDPETHTVYAQAHQAAISVISLRNRRRDFPTFAIFPADRINRSARRSKARASARPPIRRIASRLRQASAGAPGPDRAL